MNTYLKFIFILFLLLIISIFILIFVTLRSEKTIHQILYPQYYGNRFPEECFPPISNGKEYRGRVKIGYDLMKTKKVAILGLAYNLGEEKTHILMKRLSSLTKKFKDYRIIIYAADSVDHTFGILKAYQKYNKKIILPDNEIDKTGCNRIEKMCRLRNSIKETLVKTDFSPDYVICQDCDLASSISHDGMANSISYMNEWDAIFANGITNEFLFNWYIPFVGYFYYDSFAFVEDPENPIQGMKHRPVHGRGDPPFSVKSAFAGCAIYKYKMFMKYDYEERKRNMCEHVSFHRQMYHDGYRLGVNPSLLLISGRQGEGTHKTSLKTHYGKEGYRVPITLDESFNIF